MNLSEGSFTPVADPCLAQRVRFLPDGVAFTREVKLVRKGNWLRKKAVSFRQGC